MRRNLFYFISQKTLVSPEIYAAEAAKLGYHKSEEYFPLQKLADSNMYHTIPYDAGTDFYTIFEVKLGMDKITIDDGLLQIGFSERNSTFINIKGFR